MILYAALFEMRCVDMNIIIPIRSDRQLRIKRSKIKFGDFWNFITKCMSLVGWYLCKLIINTIWRCTYRINYNELKSLLILNIFWDSDSELFRCSVVGNLSGEMKIFTTIFETAKIEYHDRFGHRICNKIIIYIVTALTMGVLSDLRSWQIIIREFLMILKKASNILYIQSLTQPRHWYMPSEVYEASLPPPQILKNHSANFHS